MSDYDSDSDNSEPKMTVEEAIRNIYENSRLLDAVASHICSIGDMKAELFHLGESEWVDWASVPAKNWMTVPVKNQKAKPNFAKNRFQFSLNAGSPMSDDICNVCLEPEQAPNLLDIGVHLCANLAEISITLGLTSRDVGFEKCPVLSAMCTVQTGIWDEKHDVFPTVEQFEKGVRFCLQRLNLEHLCKPVKEEEEEETETLSLVQTEQHQDPEQAKQVGKKRLKGMEASSPKEGNGKRSRA